MFFSAFGIRKLFTIIYIEYYHVHLEKRQIVSLGGAEAQILRKTVKCHTASIIIMCRQYRDILSFVTFRRGSCEQNMIFRVLVGSIIGPEVVTEHGPKLRFNGKVDVTLVAFTIVSIRIEAFLFLILIDNLYKYKYCSYCI
jgi:hypothetical protein